MSKTAFQIRFGARVSGVESIFLYVPVHTSTLNENHLILNSEGSALELSNSSSQSEVLMCHKYISQVFHEIPKNSKYLQRFLTLNSLEEVDSEKQLGLLRLMHLAAST